MLACFFNYASVVLHLALENYIQKSIGNVTQSGDSFNFKHASSYIFKFYYLNVYVCVHTCVHMHVCIHVEVRGQPVGVRSLLPCDSRGSN